MEMARIEMINDQYNDGWLPFLYWPSRIIYSTDSAILLIGSFGRSYAQNGTAAMRAPEMIFFFCCCKSMWRCDDGDERVSILQENS